MFEKDYSVFASLARKFGKLKKKKKNWRVLPLENDSSQAQRHKLQP